jgi:hypothetical protein
MDDVITLDKIIKKGRCEQIVRAEKNIERRELIERKELIGRNLPQVNVHRRIGLCLRTLGLVAVTRCYVMEERLDKMQDTDEVKRYTLSQCQRLRF